MLKLIAPLFVLLLSAAPLAHAQEPGLHVDPGSPSGTEYRIPLDQARNDASGGGGSQAGGGGSSSGGSSGSPLFGEGVGSGGSNAGSGGGSGSRSGGSGHGGSARPGKSGGAIGTKLLPSAALDKVASNPTVGPETALLVGGIAAAVLLAGGLLGLLLRRRGSVHPPGV
jgi:hypothetical protein